MISNLYDLKTWAQAAAKGALLSDAMKKEHLAWVETGMKRFGYGLGICDIHGFIGHNGGILGYASVMLYSPEKDATIVVWFNKCNDDGKGNPEIEIAGEIIKTLFGDR